MAGWEIPGFNKGILLKFSHQAEWGFLGFWVCPKVDYA
jgi:hypothetical protein